VDVFFSCLLAHVLRRISFLFGRGTRHGGYDAFSSGTWLSVAFVWQPWLVVNVYAL
jgi:hypothetical protein